MFMQEKENDAQLVSSLLVTSTLTAYLTPYATLVHQGKGTEYPR